jgi:hypothetical protein
LQNRKQVIGLLGDLSVCVEAMHNEVLQLTDRHQLMDKGIGFIDAYLLATC